jgi:hypothetical protein
MVMAALNEVYCSLPVPYMWHLPAWSVATRRRTHCVNPERRRVKTLILTWRLILI